MYKYLIIFVFSIFLNAQNLKIASYNVENFFDLKYDKTEYNEFVPNNSFLWNQKNFNIKLNNIIKVIEDIDADIIALQEIENESLMKLLKQKLTKYNYHSFIKYQNSAVGLGFLSKIEIKNSTSIDVKFTNAIYRPILETTFIKDGIEFKVFNNHWPSKRASETYRVKYAKTLQDRLKKLPNDYDYILVGDFNSDYNEFETFKKNIKLNHTNGITGINHILNTTIEDKFITLENILGNNKRVHYNLWLDLKGFERFSTKFKNQNNTPDNIILPPSLFDNKKLSYIPNSFSVFKPDYLYKNSEINRWKMSEGIKNKIHKGEGFSDHLPIFAEFSLKIEDTNPINKININQQITDIKTLYDKNKLVLPAFLNNVIVIYKNENQAIIKINNDRAIYIFKDAKDLKLGYSYNIQVNEIYNFYGLKEIKEFIILKENDEIKNYKSLFLDASKINIFDFKYENEIISNLSGEIRKGKLFFNDKTIKLFAKDKSILPKDGEKITILEAQLASFKGNMQIVFHKKTDYKVEQ
ncbi:MULTISPECIES: endonuclease/exonuclease/phosphatase family protein [Arcobacteraceae]|uniref:endonuclease/exonuclease/phosphatase family protein n=1 Tax=Arcobacteraceae TaxID=2808963 RepID=UPI000DEA23C5|nr:endonuclease/exonuclease/phosphatase family protein [Arcobacter sp. CECT 9188]RBQ26369.1 endonuclease [Arcobacter sp. CECT 9188]